MRVRFVSVLAAMGALVLVGCARVAAPAARGERPPLTQADPLPYTPPPRPGPAADGTGLVLDEAALATAVGRRVAEALVSGDGITLRRLFATRVARTQTGGFALRDQLLDACERDIARGTARSAGVEAFVALDRIQAVASERDRSRSGLERSDYDYMVFVPLLGTADTQPSPACLPTLFVQLRPELRVVGIE